MANPEKTPLVDNEHNTNTCDRTLASGSNSHTTRRKGTETSRDRNGEGVTFDVKSKDELYAQHELQESPEEHSGSIFDKEWWKSNFFLSEQAQFGTWDGVFTTCMINIFGVLMFLRIGWMVGYAGTAYSILIVILSSFVAFVAVTSAVGICERCFPERGGVYFLLNHVIGARVGASIGLIFCFGQSVACALYVVGFGESVTNLLRVNNQWVFRGIGIVLLFVLWAIQTAGVKWVIRLQLVLLLIISAAVVDFLLGSLVHSKPEFGFIGYNMHTFLSNVGPSFASSSSSFSSSSSSPSPSLYSTTTANLTNEPITVPPSYYDYVDNSDLNSSSSSSSLSSSSSSSSFSSSSSDYTSGTYNSTSTDNQTATSSSQLPVYTFGFQGNHETSFLGVLGVFFPAATGVFAGINMSGDLRSPSKSIPLGTFSALGTSTLLYIVFALILGSTCTRYSLQSDYLIAEKVSATGLIFLCGLYTSSVSSGMGSLYGSPKILECIVEDNVLPFLSFLDKWKSNNRLPNLPLLLITLISLIFILIGRVNTLAPIVAVPFVMTYAAVNWAHFSLASSFERRGLNNYTPVIDVYGEKRDGEIDSKKSDGHVNTMITSQPTSFYSVFCNRWLSLLGFFISLTVMFCVQWIFSVIIVVIFIIIYSYIFHVNPGAFPGISDFSLSNMFVNLIKCLFSRHRQQRDETSSMVVTSTPPPTPQTMTSEMNDVNEDYPHRNKYHKSEDIQDGQLF